MLKLMKTKYAFLAPIFLTLTMGLNSCGEKEATLKQPLVYSFKHKLPESFYKNRDITSDALQPFIDDDIFFRGAAMRNIENAPDVEFDIGVQFNAKTQGRKIFVEKLILDTPDLQTERVVNEFVDIDVFSKRTKIYFKRFLPFEKISGDSIPLTAEFFTLTIDYRLDDKPTQQMSIRFDNVSFLGPVL